MERVGTQAIFLAAICGDELVRDHVGVLEAVGPGLDRPAEEVVLGLELTGVDGDEPFLGVSLRHGGQDFLPGKGAEDLDQVGPRLELGPDAPAEAVRPVHLHRRPVGVALGPVAARAGDALAGDDGTRADEQALLEGLAGHDPDVLIGHAVADCCDPVHEAGAEQVGRPGRPR